MKWKKWLGPALVIAVTAVSVTVMMSTASASGDDHDQWLYDVDYYLEVDEVRELLLRDLENAEDRIDVALKDLDDEDIEGALLDAANRGVKVRVVADEEDEPSGRFDALIDHEDISVVFGNGELAYLPEPNLSPILEFCNQELTSHDDHIVCTQAQQQQNTDNQIVRPANYNTMSHTFFLIDTAYTWNITAPMTEEQLVWPSFRIMSEEVTQSFDREFRQMHGGVFSTTLSVYNGPLKSITQQEPLRMTNRGQLRIRFNPQERLVKNIVDETFRTKGSVFVMTENLTNEDLIAALQYKIDHGFDVRVMVGQNQAQESEIRSAVDALGAVEAPALMGRLPTMVVHNSERDRNGNRQPRTVQVLSHELWRARPFEVIRASGSDRVKFYPSDTFADGVMWEIVESGNDRNPEVDRFLDYWEQAWQEATDE